LNWFGWQKLLLVEQNKNGVMVRPQPDLLPQEKEQHRPVLILRMTLRQIQWQVFQ
jgi:hypothetical protein